MPEPDGPFAYFTRYREGGQHPARLPQSRARAAARRSCSTATRKREGHAFFDLGGAEHSPDHQLLAWSADTKGSEYFTIRVRDLATGADLADEVARTSGGIVWLGNSAGFYYVELDDNHRPVRVQRHRLGDDGRRGRGHLRGARPGFLREDRRDAIRRLRSSSRRAITRRRKSACSTVRDPDAAPRLVAARTPQILYDVEHHGDDLIIRHQRRRRRGLQDRDGAGRRTRARQLARPRALTGPA